MHVLEKYDQLDERGVQRPSILLAESSGLKQLLDECRLLPLQLSDALALICHLLGRWAGGQGLLGLQPQPHLPTPHLSEKTVLFFQHEDSLLLPGLWC